MYSCAVWAAKIHNATMPKRPAALLKLSETPVGRANTSRPILTPRSPFPSGESTSKNKSEVTKPVTNVTAAIVEIESEGRFNLVNSALNTFHIITHPSFQKKYLPKMHALASNSLR